MYAIYIYTYMTMVYMAYIYIWCIYGIYEIYIFQPISANAHNAKYAWYLHVHV